MRFYRVYIRLTDGTEKTGIYESDKDMEAYYDEVDPLLRAKRQHEKDCGK